MDLNVWGLFSLRLCFSLLLVSERVYKEYDQLKSRYEVETGAMHQAMQRASEVSWPPRQARHATPRALKRLSKTISIQFPTTRPSAASATMGASVRAPAWLH